jgi:hypothetical protein
MAQPADGPPDNSTAWTCNRSAKNRPPSTSDKLTNKKLATTQRTKLYPLKFEYNVKTANVNIAQLHGRDLKAIAASHGSDVTFFDKNGEEEFQLNKLPQNQVEWSAAFHMQTVTNSRNSNSIIMVGMELTMSISISDLKSGIQTVLREVDGFIKYNAWGKRI